jgi:hypothetical protein
MKRRAEIVRKYWSELAQGYVGHRVDETDSMQSLKIKKLLPRFQDSKPNTTPAFSSPQA